MRLYNNSAWAGVPSQTSVVPTFDVTLPVGSGGAPFTVEITGSTRRYLRKTAPPQGA
jgi:hypothetical protein